MSSWMKAVLCKFQCAGEFWGFSLRYFLLHVCPFYGMDAEKILSKDNKTS
jgi:hypothetical protein